MTHSYIYYISYTIYTLHIHTKNSRVIIPLHHLFYRNFVLACEINIAYSRICHFSYLTSRYEQENCSIYFFFSSILYNLSKSIHENVVHEYAIMCTLFPPFYTIFILLQFIFFSYSSCRVYFFPVLFV